MTPQGEMHVATILNDRGERTFWPAWSVENGNWLVDLRMLGEDCTPGYYPEKLRSSHISEFLVQQAGESKPQGFIQMAKQ